MRNQSSLIARALQLPQIKSKQRLAQALDTSHQNLNHVEHGRRNFTERQAVLLAELLGQPIPDVLALIGEDKAKTEEEREFWRRRAPRVLATTAVWIVAVVAALTGMPRVAHASAESAPVRIMYRRVKARRDACTFFVPVPVS